MTIFVREQRNSWKSSFRPDWLFVENFNLGPRAQFLANQPNSFFLDHIDTRSLGGNHHWVSRGTTGRELRSGQIPPPPALNRVKHIINPCWDRLAIMKTRVWERLIVICIDKQRFNEKLIYSGWQMQVHWLDHLLCSQHQRYLSPQAYHLLHSWLTLSALIPFSLILQVVNHHRNTPKGQNSKQVVWL